MGWLSDYASTHNEDNSYMGKPEFVQAADEMKHAIAAVVRDQMERFHERTGVYPTGISIDLEPVWSMASTQAAVHMTAVSLRFDV